jgi:ArsR family transcriptional regulator
MKNTALRMSPEATFLVASKFKVLSEPIRLQILQFLEDGEASVSKITEGVGASQPNVSKHLKMLQDAGFVSRRSDGNLAFYSIADESVFELCRVVCGSLKEQFSRRAAVMEL